MTPKKRTEANGGYDENSVWVPFGGEAVVFDAPAPSSKDPEPLPDCCAKLVGTLGVVSPAWCPSCRATLAVRDREWHRFPASPSNYAMHTAADGTWHHGERLKCGFCKPVTRCNHVCPDHPEKEAPK